MITRLLMEYARCVMLVIAHLAQILPPTYVLIATQDSPSQTTDCVSKQYALSSTVSPVSIHQVCVMFAPRVIISTTGSA